MDHINPQTSAAKPRDDDDYPLLTEVVASPAKPSSQVSPQRLSQTQPLEALFGEMPKRPLDAQQTALRGDPPMTLGGFDQVHSPNFADPHLAPVSQHELELRDAVRGQEAAQLRDEIEGAILGDLNMRIEPMVEARLKEKLADLLEQVLAGMTAELKLAVRDIVREAVDQAVSQEWAARDKRLLAKK